MKKKDKDIVKDIETRIRTTMIGSLHRIEKSFGYLWNHGSESKSDLELEFEDKWEDLRLDILNHGNHQIRLALQDLKNFFADQEKYLYNYNFVFKNKDNNRRDKNG
jgi:hypothetical protein